MFEGIVIDLLNKYLGEFLVGIDKENIKIKVWGGDVDLRDVVIRPDALAFLELPITVRSGKVGRIRIKANWRKLGSEVVKLVLENVTIVAGTCDLKELSADEILIKTKERATQQLMAKLNRLSLVEQALLASELLEGDSAAQKAGFVEKLVTKVVDNVQVEVRNIHLRFEDDGASALGAEGPRFAVGVCLAEVAAATTNQEGEAAFLVDVPTVFKKVVLRDLFVYVEPQSNPLRSAEELLDYFAREKKANCIINPMRGQLLARLEKKEVAPKVALDSVLESFSLGLSEPQYHTLLRLLGVLESLQAKLAKREQLFPCPFRKNTKEEGLKYVELYKRTLNAQWLEELTPEELKIKESLEAALVYESLATLRAIAVAELRRELQGNPVTLRTKPKKPGLFGRMFGRKEEAKEAPGHQLTEDERKFIFEQVEFDPAAEEALKGRPPSFVELEVKYVLKEALVRLTDARDHTLLLLKADDMRVNAAKRSTSLSVQSAIGSLSLTEGICTKTLFPKLISTTTLLGRAAEVLEKEGRNSPFFSVAVDLNPLDSEADTRVVVALKPALLVVNPTVIARLQRFFQPPASAAVSVEVMRAWSSARLLELRAAYAVSLSEALAEHSAVDVRLNLAAPQIVLVRDCVDREAPLLVADLGTASLHTELQPKQSIEEMQAVLKEGMAEERLTEEQRNHCYDQFVLRLHNLQLSTCTFASASRPHFLVRPFTLALELFASIAPSLRWLPSFKAHARLPSLHASLQPRSYNALMAVLDAFSALGGEEGAIETTTEAPKPFLELIDELDVDGDGVLTLEELKAAMGLAEAKMLINEVADATGMLSVERLRSWWTQRQANEASQTLFQLDFVVESLMCSLSSDDVSADALEAFAAGERPAPPHSTSVLLLSRMEGLSLKLAARAADTELHLNMQHWQVDDPFAPNAARGLLRAGSAGDSFVVFDMQLTSPDHPAYGERERVQTNVELSAAEVDVVVDAVRCAEVLGFLLLRFLPAGTVAGAVGAVIVEEKEEQKSMQVEEKQEEGVAMKVARVPFTVVRAGVKFGGVKLTFRCGPLELFEARVCGFSTQFAQYPLSFALQLGLDELTLVDCVAREKGWPQQHLVRSAGEGVVKLHVDAFAPQEEEFPGVPMKIDARLSGLQTVLVMRTVEELTAFVTDGPLAVLLQKLGDQPASPAEVQAAPVEGMDLKVVLENLRLLVPVSSHDSVGLVAALPKVRVCMHSAVNDDEQVAVSMAPAAAGSSLHVQVSAFRVLDSTVEDCAMFELGEVGVTGSLDAQQTALHVDLGSAEGTLAKASYGMLMQVLAENFTESGALLPFYTKHGLRCAALPSAVTGPSSSSASGALRLTVALARVRLGLTEEWRADAPPSLLELGVSEASVELESTTRLEKGKVCSRTALQATVKTMAVIDTSDEKLRFKQMVELPRRAQADKPSLRVLFVSDTAAPSDTLALTLFNARVCLTPALFLLADFFAVAPAAQPVPLVAPPGDGDVPATARARGLHVSFLLQGPLLQVVERPLQAHSKAVAVACGLQGEARVNGEEVLLEVELKQLKAFTTEFDAQEHSGYAALNVEKLAAEAESAALSTGRAAHVVSPFNARLSLALHTVAPLHTASQLLVADLDIGPVAVWLNYSDYRLLLASAAALSPPPAAEDAPPAVAPAAVVAEFGEQRVRIVQRGVVVELSNDVSGTEIPFARLALLGAGEEEEKIEEEEKKEETKMEVYRCEDHIHTELARLVDPARRTEVAAESALSVELFASGARRGVTGRVQLQFEYFNGAIVQWEPVLEPWTVSFTLTQTLLPSLQLQSALQLQGAALHLNVTTAMYSTIMDALALLTQAESEAEEEEEKKEVRERFLPYRIENHTEYPLTLHAPDLPDVALEPFSKRSLAQLAWLHRPGAKSQSVSVDLTTSAGVESVPLDLSMTFVLARPLQTKDTVVVELGSVGAVKVLQFHAGLGLQNHTQTPFTFRCGAHSASVAADEMAWVPLGQCAGEGRVELKAADGNEWSRALEWKEGGPAPGWQELNAPHDSWCVCVKQGDAGTVCHVYAPVEVDNLLPVAASVNLTAGGRSTSLELASGLACKAVSTVVHSDTSFAVALPSLPECGASKAVPLPLPSANEMEKANASAAKAKEKALPVVKKHVRLTMEDKQVVWFGRAALMYPQGRSLVLEADLLFSGALDCLLVRVLVYSAFWLFDMTGYGLQLSEDKEAWCVPNQATLDLEAKEAEERVPAVMFSINKAKKAKAMVFARAARVQLADGEAVVSEWSEELNLNLLGHGGALTMKAKGKEGQEVAVEVAVTIRAAGGRFFRTKVVTFAPRVVLVNTLPHTLEFHQTGEVVPHTLAPKAVQPFFWPNAAGERAIEVRVSLWKRSGWSGCIPLLEMGDRVMMLPVAPGCDANEGINLTSHPFEQLWSETPQPRFLRVEVRSEQGRVFVLVGEVDAAVVPFRVENRTVAETLLVRESGTSLPWTAVHPFSAVPFAWSGLPDAKKRLEVAVVGGSELDGKHISLAKPRTLSAIVLPANKLRPLARKLFLRVQVHGPTKILVASELPAPQEGKEAREARSAGLMQRFQQLREELTRLRAAEATLAETVQHAKAKEPPRPKHVQPERSVLRVGIISGHDLGTKKTYAVVDINGVQCKTPIFKTSDSPVWDTTFEFDSEALLPDSRALSGGDLPSCQQPCISSVKLPRRVAVTVVVKKDGIFSDDTLGQVQFWTDSLRDFRPHERKVALQPMERGQQTRGSLRLQLWWVAPHTRVLQRRLAFVRHRIASHERVCAVFDGLRQGNRVRDPFSSDTALLGDAEGPTEFEFEVDVQAVRGMQEALQSADSQARVVCAVRWPEEKASIGTATPLLVKGLSVLDHWEDLTKQVCTRSSAEGAATVELWYEGRNAADVGSRVKLGEALVPLSGFPLEAELDPDKDAFWVPVTPNESGVREAGLKALSKSKGLALQLRMAKRFAPPSDEVPAAKLQLLLQEVGVSFVDATPREMLFLQLNGLLFEVEDAEAHTTLELRLAHLQLDNVLPRALYPVILAPTPVRSNVRQPVLQVSVHREKAVNFRPPTALKRQPKDGLGECKEGEEEGWTAVHPFRYASYLMQALDVKVEEKFVWELIRYVTELVASFESPTQTAKENAASRRVEHVSRCLSAVRHSPASSNTYIFCNFLQIQPIRINLSLQLDPLRDHHDDSVSVNPFFYLGAIVGGTFGNVGDAPLRLNGITIVDAHGTPETLTNSLVQKFSRDALREVYKILGSIEVLGNPVNLVSNLGEGVMDFFYEPVKGIVKSPAAFGKGFAVGTFSLLNNTFAGVLGAASRITGSLAQGVASISLDEEYVAEREQRGQDQPTHIGKGLLKGAKSLGMGLFKGVTGVFVDPVKGAKKGGVKGFFKGMGKGILGVVAKPASGAIDMSSQVLKGIANTPAALLYDTQLNSRARPQRYIPRSSRQLLPFHLDAAIAGAVLDAVRAPKGRGPPAGVANEQLLLSMYVNNRRLVLVTTARWVVVKQQKKWDSGDLQVRLRHAEVRDRLVFQAWRSEVQTVTAVKTKLEFAFTGDRDVEAVGCASIEEALQVATVLTAFRVDK